jgi:hypothetical protein
MNTTVVTIGACLCLIALAQKQTGPPGFVPNAHPIVRQVRQEPLWAKSRLQRTRADLGIARVEVEAATGPILHDAFLGESRAEAELKLYTTSRQGVHAFKALYLWIASGSDSKPTRYEDLWAVLPVDEYEVARLHFIWGAGEGINILASLGDRLLAKDPRDLEVLYVSAFLRSYFKPEMDLAKAEKYAHAALSGHQSPSTFLRYGMVKMFQARDTKSAAAGKVAKKYIDMYLGSANPKDTRHLRLARTWLTWLGQQGY